MKIFTLTLILISCFKINAQTIDSCSSRIFINKYGYNWNLEIENPIYNKSFEIKNQYGIFKLKIDKCIGVIVLSLYKNDTLLEQGSLQISNTLRVDSHYVENSLGEIELASFHHFSASKIGTWLYWNQKSYLKKEEGIK